MIKKKNKKMQIFGGVALVAFAVAMFLTVVGLSASIASIKEEAIARTPDAILTSAGVSNETAVSLPVIYYDQKADECVNLYDRNTRDALFARQFEWSKCGYHNKKLEQGIVEFELGSDYLPVAVGGKLTSDRGVKGDNFARWFSAVEGKSQSYAGVLKLDYNNDGAEFSFYKSEFYPLDTAEFSAGDLDNDGHNHLFTMSFAVPFNALLSGNENLMVAADDDTFVFIGDKLAIDMGGVHGETVGQLVVHDDGEVYAGVEGEDLAYSGIQLREDEDTIVRVFHADRDSTESSFNIRLSGMNLTVMNAEMAGQKGEGVQIAYDPTDPSYVAPLGVSSVVRPDGTKGMIVVATIEGVLVVLFAVFVVISAKVMIRRKTKI